MPTERTRAGCPEQETHDAFFREVLRPEPHPPEHLDEATVHSHLVADPAGYLTALASRLRDIADGRLTLDLPVKRILADPGEGGDFRVMPCVLRGAGSPLKTVKIVGTNSRQRRVPDQITVGQAYRLDPAENFITHTFEACLLSSARTGACAATAVGRLADRSARVTVIGAGRVGYYAALYIAQLSGVRRVELRDLKPQRAAAAAAALTGQGGSVVFAAEEPAAPLAAEVVVLATTAFEPVLGPGDTDAPLVVSTGADTHEQRELAAGWAQEARLFVDNRDSREVGDLLAWGPQGVAVPAELPDLVDIHGTRAEHGGGRRKVFVSTGSALLDNLTIGYLLDRLESTGGPG